MTEIPEIGGGQFASDKWYYFKKSLPLYPGIRDYSCADFMDRYYAYRKSQLSPGAIFRNALVYPSFKAWIRIRARSVAKTYGLSRQWSKNASELARRHFIDPNDLAWFRVDTDEKAKNLLRRFEYASLNKLINPRNWQEDCVLGNKIAFHNICKRHDIAHPQILATVHKGSVNIFSEPGQDTLAIKPSGGEGGRGFALAKIDRQTPDLQAHMRERIVPKTDNRACGWLVQDKLENHAALKPLAQSAVITARFVTMLNEKDMPELIAAVLRFPSDPNIRVDNLKAGALMARINLETGQLDKGCYGRGAHDVETHPVSGVAIAGFDVPFVQEAKALVLSAHDKGFRDYCLVGWDIVITEDGPLILEGNGKPGIDITQRGMWQNAGEGRFGELLALHIDKALSQIVA